MEAGVPAPTSIADRIAALKLNQVGRAPGSQSSSPSVPTSNGITSTTNGQRRPPPPPPPARPQLPARPVRQQSTNLPPTQDIAPASQGTVGNLPDQIQPARTTESSRPPLPSRPSQANQVPSLPPRRPSDQPSPALPPRRPSEAPSQSDAIRSRRGSNESVSSVATGRSSMSATSIATSLTSNGGYNRVRAPEYDPATLPRLPPNRTKEEKEADARRYAGLRPLRQTKSSPKVEQLSKETTPPPPPRTIQPPPDVVSRPRPVAQEQPMAIEAAPPPQPPRPGLAIPPRPRQSALAFGMNKSTETPPPLPGTRPVRANGVPPPIPSASKPDLASLQASKPKLNGVPSSSGVVELTPATFDEVVLRSGRPTFVDFYLPWCKPCQEFAPTYEEVAQKFDRQAVTIAKFDNGTHKAIGEKYGVKCWPTLLWFDGRSDQPIDYRPLGRGWDVEWLSEFITEQTGCAPQSIPAPPSSSSTSGSCLLCRDFSAPDNHAARFPRQSLPSFDLDWLAQQLTRPFPSATDKARTIFTWLHHNVEYDVVAFFNDNVRPSTPQSTLQTGLAVCEGYAALFSALALKAGMESLVVGGHGKGYGHTDLQPGEPVPPYKAGHAWNAVRIDHGEWKLIDACWGAGNVNGKGQPYNKHFTPSWFTRSNDEFGLSHFPGDSQHQFRNDGRRVSWEEYFAGSKTGCGAQVYNGYVQEEGLDEKSFQPVASKINPHGQPGPTIRFAFQKICPHWDPLKNGRGPYLIYTLHLQGLDGTQRNHIPFETNGDVWWCDVPVQDLGHSGQTAQINVVTKFDGRDARGLTIQEYRQKIGRVGLAWAGVCKWEIA